MRKLKGIIPCVCIDHKPDVGDSVYFGMPQLKVSVGIDTGKQFYSAYCPACGRGGCTEFRSAYLALKNWNDFQNELWKLKKEGILF